MGPGISSNLVKTLGDPFTSPQIQIVMPGYSSQEIYKGPETIVVAMDIGTTNSAVSFAYLSPGSRPQSKMVSFWPASVSGLADKTPSMISYKNGQVQAHGIDAIPDFEQRPENVAYWFKLHLHPATMSRSFNSQEFEVPPLPKGVTIEQVYADMMRYLMDSTHQSFAKTTPNGAQIWARLRDTMVIVLATPNGWDLREQGALRKAAIRASLVTEENAGHLLQFVTESEASVHYALASNHNNWLQKNTVFAVMDCGGSTVDTAVYRCISTNPLSLKEACPSECVQAGGIFVNREFTKMLENKFKGSTINNPNFIRSVADAFEKELKPYFDGTRESQTLKLGYMNDDYPGLGIEGGRITLPTTDLEPVFDVVTDKICNNCVEVLRQTKVEYVLLVGGFGDSPYVRKALAKRLVHGVEMTTIDDFGRKAAAEGAIIGHIKQFVVARAAKATFGGCVRECYDKKLHRERRHTAQLYADGKKRVDGAFHVWIKKGDVLRGTFAHKLPYHVAWDAASTSQTELVSRLGTIGLEVFAWEGDSIPTWCKDEHGGVLKGMRLICTLNADLSALAGGLQTMITRHGKKFYRVDYNVCVYFGGTQLRAKLQWKEKGVFREGPVTVMPYIA
ncbi:hypothetical protein M408DRAFT_333875 [Serendipita vermifera MAFF 305830]|uniref:Uncharacterized protein n=1 Tax=Serendipita vermifera MAFF 305830 TaxID=933852 RepID=A0A0C3AKX2_SERVB|nr:hypothetical protein M408DRAFT_333875 [Serendipita vermifera MAFF 305830]